MRNKSSNRPVRNIFRPAFRRKTAGVTRIRRDNYGNNWYEIIKEVLERDQYKCQNELIVAAKLTKCHSKKDVQVHHILPLSRGGKSEKNNLITLCKDCHESRHSHMRMAIP